MGLGTSEIDCEAIIEGRKILLVNLGLSGCLAEEQQRLIGTLLINEFFETAMRRPTGAAPHYLYIDEAGLFITPELAKALDQCRKKGLHITAGVQHLGQLKDDERIYKSFKNSARNKVIFAVPDRQDASELADDLFPDLTEPRVKLIREHLNHLIRDVRDTSSTESRGRTKNRSSTVTCAQSASRGTTASRGTARSANFSDQQSFSETLSEGDGASLEVGRAGTVGYAEQESDGWSDSQTTSYERSRGSSNTSGHSFGSGASSGQSWNFDDGPGAATMTRGQNSTWETSSSNSDSEGESLGEGTSHGYQETRGTTRSAAVSANVSLGWNRNQARSWAAQEGTSRGTGLTYSEQAGESEGATEGLSQATSRGKGETITLAVTDQPGTRHIPFLEKQPEYRSLEERRWQAAELLIGQQLGKCYAKVASSHTLVPVSVRPPRKLLLPRAFLLRPLEAFLSKHSIRRETVDPLILERRNELIQRAYRDANEESRGANREEVHTKGATRTRRHKRPGDQGTLFDDLFDEIGGKKE